MRFIATTIGSLLRSAFNLRPGEGFRVGMMFLYSLASIGGVIILGRAVSRTLFLSLMPEAATPYKFILPPLFVVATIAVYTRFAPRYTLTRLTIGTNLLLISGIFLFRYFLDTQYGQQFGLLAALFVYFEIMVSLVGIQFWTLAAELFNPREAKRVFGLIAAGGVLANAVTGAGLRLVSASLLPKDLLFLVAISLLLGVGCVWLLSSHPQERASAPAEKVSLSLVRDLKALRQSPLLVTIGGLMIITSLITNIADYQLDLSLQRFFAQDGQRMLAFLGSFQLWTGAAAILFQLFGTNRIMERFGLLVGLLVLPLGVAFGSTAFLITGGALWTIALPRGADMVLRYTVNDSSLNILFLPVPDELRRRAKGILDGIVKPPVIGLLGLLFLLFLRRDIDLVGVQAGDVVPWSFVALALVLVWLRLVWRTRRQYTAALTDSLRQRRLNLEDIAIDVSDETTVQVLAEGLGDAEEMQVIHALRLIEQAPGKDWRPYVAPLLHHASPQVRLMTARYLGQSIRYGEASVYSEQIAALFNAPEVDVRAVAVEAYCALKGPNAIEGVTPFLEKPNLVTRQAAIVGLVKYSGLDGMLHAAAHLKEMLEADEPIVRQAGAEILGRLEIQTFYQPLIPLLQDGNTAVQINAIRAASKVRHPDLIPHLIEKLRRSATAVYAIEALVAYGTGIESALAEVMAGNTAAEVRAQIPKVLRQLQSPQAAKILLRHLEDENDYVRSTIYKALAKLHAAGVDFKIAYEVIYQAVLKELRHYYLLVVIRDDLGEEGCGRLLGVTLQEHQEYTLDRLFFLLSLYYPYQSMALVRQALASSDQHLRANAIELLDTLAEREIRELLLPLVEAPLAQIVALAQNKLAIAHCSMVDRLAELAAHPDPWVQACALFQVGQLQLVELQMLVEDGLRSTQPLVRETAVVASRRLFPIGRFHDVLLAQVADPAFPQVQQYALALLSEENDGISNH